jgi:hypothetical protein
LKAFEEKSVDLPGGALPAFAFHCSIHLRLRALATRGLLCIGDRI